MLSLTKLTELVAVVVADVYAIAQNVVFVVVVVVVVVVASMSLFVALL